MTVTKEQTVTRSLFWAAFGIFLAVSIPHIAWVFRAYEPQESSPFISGFWWVLAYGFAIAIDAVIAWLSHAGSSGDSRSDKAFTWGFIGALVAMSWYYNWVFSIAHDPSNPDASKHVWSFVLIDHWGILPQVTVGSFTPVIISALPLFIIAYTFILRKVNAMKVTAAKSVEELEREAQEAERRAEAERRIQAAYHQPKGQGATELVVKNAFGLVKVVREEAGQLVGQKRDPEAEKQEKVVTLFRDTPSLLNDENAELAETAIMEVLHIKRPAAARFWRLKVAEVLSQEAKQNARINDVKEELKIPETDKVKAIHVEPQNDTGDEGKNDEKPEAEHQQKVSQKELSDDEQLVVKRYPKMLALLATGETTATLETISAATGYGVKKLQNRVAKGEIKATPRNKNIVFIDSVIDWLKEALFPSQSERATERIIAVKTATRSPHPVEEKEDFASDKPQALCLHFWKGGSRKGHLVVSNR